MTKEIPQTSVKDADISEQVSNFTNVKHVMVPFQCFCYYTLYFNCYVNHHTMGTRLSLAGISTHAHTHTHTHTHSSEAQITKIPSISGGEGVILVIWRSWVDQVKINKLLTLNLL